MINNTYEIGIPFFPGFYSSTLMDSDRLYEIAKEMSNETGKDINADDLNFDSKAYIDACSKAFVKAFKKKTPSIIKEVKSHYLFSPKEYNYHNDNLYIFVVLNDNWRDEVLTFIDNNEQWMKKKLIEDWKSRDGFISFVPYTINEWKAEFSKDEPNPTFINPIIEYMMVREHGENIDIDLIEETLEDVNMEDYVKQT